jgi:hypothetical protein
VSLSADENTLSEGGTLDNGNQDIYINNINNN